MNYHVYKALMKEGGGFVREDRKVSKDVDDLHQA